MVPEPEPLVLRRHPLYSTLLPIPIICFLGALITDFSYRGSGGNFLWLNFSSWLISAGLVTGAIAAVVFLVTMVLDSALRHSRGLIHLLLALGAWVTELFNAFIHARDGWTAVVPTGLTLSIVGTILALAGGLVWQSIRYGWRGRK